VVQRRVALALVACIVGTGVLAQTIAAKEDIMRLRVCGATACRIESNIVVLRQISTGIGANPRASRPQLARYYTLQAVPALPPWQGYIYLPAQDVAATKWEHRRADWYRVGWLEPVLSRVTRGLAPHTRPRSWSQIRWP
jgi:hypothetical protein